MRVNFDKIYDSVKDLANRLLTIQAKGDYAGAKAFIEKSAVMLPPMQTLVNKLSNLPVDIRPIYQIEQEIEGK